MPPDEQQQKLYEGKYGQQQWKYSVSIINPDLHEDPLKKGKQNSEIQDDERHE
ncbi:hypothetical protein CJ030_MR2G011222 [Morella rubra]|uniref:Uncharacterized protein n=1 Tax=Morella rubra TaxID=262757 RepID=A0A6A1WFB9_9ROSI|nr:hypothetical protein CJ030_MR2G011222 [Morella rubra]